MKKNRKVYAIRDGRIEEVKGEALDRVRSVYTSERMTLGEFKRQYPDNYKKLIGWIKSL